MHAFARPVSADVLICPPWQIKSGHLGCGKLTRRANQQKSVQPLLQKYFPSPLTQIRCISIDVSFRSEGRSRVVTSAGRDAVDARASGDVRGWQGGVDKARELTNGTQTNDA